MLTRASPTPSTTGRPRRCNPTRTRRTTAAVADELRDANGGSVRSYARHHPDDPERGLVMGYYTWADLRVYGHLAREFCLYDRWFAAVPDATWPNRLYAAVGRKEMGA